MRIRLDLNPEMTKALLDSAAKELRPVHWQALLLLRRALGLPDIVEPAEPEKRDSDHEH